MRVRVERGERRNGYVYHIGDGWHYHKKSTKRNKIYYQCIGKRKLACPGRAVSNAHGDGFTHSVPHRYHNRDPFYPAVLELRRRILAKSGRSVWQAPSQIVNREAENFPVEVAARVYLSKIRSSIYRVKVKHFPPVPQDMEEMGDYLHDPTYNHICNTTDGRDNILAGSFGDMENGTKCIIFVSDRFRDHMRNVQHVFSDGTFRTRTLRPRTIQIFNIVEIRRYHVIPLVRILMQRRTRAAYEVALQALKDLVPHFRPRTAMTDYEPAMQQAWVAIFGVILLGCLYHYDVAVCRKSLRLGLREFLNENERASSIVRCLCALPLLPRHLMYTGLMELGQEALAIHVMDVLRPLFVYMEETWFGRCQILSVMGADHRTNNACETDNRSLAREVGLSHPNSYHLVGAFVRSEAIAYRDLYTITVLREGPSRHRKKSAIRNDQRIAHFTEELQMGEIDILTFLHSASQTVRGVFEDWVIDNSSDEESEGEEEGEAEGDEDDEDEEEDSDD